uniref:Uncharacterized protein n=1 Tax=Arundo donax TaxID=35708 RepID=A0A0A9F092_ARUDO
MQIKRECVQKHQHKTIFSPEKTEVLIAFFSSKICVWSILWKM